ncbi:MAG: hypothetical protein HC875_27235, partial [Anaerolineales bacterium]|nr:hypothetical protein [Anaerolineales bacterium]
LAVLTDLGRQIGQFMARKEAEAALRESRERLELVLEGAELGMWDWHIPSARQFLTSAGLQCWATAWPKLSRA